MSETRPTKRSASDADCESPPASKRPNKDQHDDGNALIKAPGATDTEEKTPNSDLEKQLAEARLLCQQKDDEIQTLKKKLEEVEGVDASSDKVKLQQLKKDLEQAQNAAQERKKRESSLMLRLTQKQTELHSLKLFSQDLFSAQRLPEKCTRRVLLDPAVNLEFKLISNRLTELEEKLAHEREQANAAKFTKDSQMGMRLIEKCKKLQKENEEYGKQVAEGSVQALRKERDLYASRLDDNKRLLAEALTWIEKLKKEREEYFAEIYKLQHAAKTEKRQSRDRSRRSSQERDSRGGSKSEHRSKGHGSSDGGEGGDRTRRRSNDHRRD